MSNVLLGIIGVIFFIGLAIAGASFFGQNFLSTKVDARASEYLNQSSQISRAIELYASDNGKLPIQPGAEPVDILVANKYMSKRPPGGTSPWAFSAQAKALVTRPEGSAAEGLKVCVAARKRAGMTSPDNVLACDGSDGVLLKKDPCCLM